MADLGRQLQQYLAQSKAAPAAASSAAPAPPSAARPQEEAGSSGLGARLGALNPFPPGRGEAPAAAAGSGPGSGWPWAAEADPCLPGLSRRQRLAGSGLCLLLAALCFGLAALYAPLLPLRARKFGLLWSLGSLCALGAAALLRGPARLLREPGRASLLYAAGLGGTLYAALALRSALLTALGAAVQLGAAAAALLALLPGGAAGLRLLSGLLSGLLSAALRRRGKTLPL
ncbi:vesicle transport protein SFT2C [Colius striatus]|uniref:vesicle transport protein SFT2C n=1 Tax=Colius striatus TaxID=57412 RepID=UPI002B1D99E4|nr:vesicle transport protein SFT2C [Colius striatus]XP_061862204.1 vesicle transport protein SFT2C [Colius striatus]XP_061862205.1 vesicle transport protein SFT2C [Colius striatus]XP_061862206.1 vesicle transport protein SFT2C [Colius striatus]XP_061862207.1 vesicle transport protein SFT2C [Colius striatus]XP_061862208.1 vesicle transport protein SFT2C [Colius striatus]XP_061862210.1 vesicle transport protein SFT2C [Colius striatus]XP_061862211.1 vesicle transport protein SFT2C [Colius stria